MGGYLHLYYSDYISDNNPASILAAGKQLIKAKAEARLNTKIKSSKEVERKFEKLYALENQNLVNPDVNQRINAHEPNFQDFDAAIATLQQKVKEGGSVIEAIDLGNRLIEIIDQELRIGADTMGLAESAIYEVEQARQELIAIRTAFTTMGNGANAKDVDQSIKDKITGLHSNAAGYLLELAWIEAFINANATSLGQMISIGGKEFNINGLKIKLDPRLEKDYQKLKAIMSKSNVQTGVDAVFNLHPNGVFGKTTWVGFQIKNYQDLSAVEIGNYTIKDFWTESFYPDEFMVNVAGALTAPYSEYGPYNKWGQLPQEAYDASSIYLKMINSTKLLAIADLIAGKMRGLAHKRHYWVVRGKATKKVNVIGTSFILERIKQNYITDNKAIGLGFSTGATGLSMNTYMDKQQYENINASNFDGDDNTGWKRSINSFSTIYDKILDTKITVSLNFSNLIV